MPLQLQINGEPAELSLDPGASLQDLVAERALRPDRIAIERNGEIVPRTRWAQTALAPADRLEIVHFVGGGRL